MQTILGAGGAIGFELAKALVTYTTDIRLVSRNPEKVNSTDELVKADLLDFQQVRKAVEGSSIVYVTAGLPYKAKVWKRDWPILVSNVIKACKEHGCKLVFFDNMYSYDPVFIQHMTEETPVNPSSEKGKVRAGVIKQIMDEATQGSLEALIARCADYYGPNIKDTSMLTEAVINPLREGKKANWMGSDKFKHSFTFTEDAGKATALLGNTPDAYNQIWHMPTAPDPPTGKEWIHALAFDLGVEPQYRVAPRYMVRIISLFVPFMREMIEMLYQYEKDYLFDSSKFEKRFNISPTPYAEGIKKTVKG